MQSTPVIAPREGVNDDELVVVEWFVPSGSFVEQATPIVTVETTKSAIDVEAPVSGYVHYTIEPGTEVAIDTVLALLTDSAEAPVDTTPPAPVAHASSDQVITKKAADKIAEHGLSVQAFSGLEVVREADVDRVLATMSAPAVAVQAESLDPRLEQSAAELSELVNALQQQKRTKFGRRVPVGDLLTDRWAIARDYGFGEGTSVYDSCLILGDVRMGRHCWVGPGTILDGSGEPLVIGDYCDIGAGVHIYTHNSIERTLTGHAAPLFRKATTIGSYCFIAPNSIVAPGTVIRDHTFVAAASYVEGSFAPNSYLAGNPAERVGDVVISGGRARIRRS